MAFSQGGMQTGALTKHSHIFSYASSDNAATVEGANYFDSMASTLPSVGFIFCIDTDGTSLNIYGFTNDGTNVTLMTGAVAVTGPGVEFT